MSIPYICLYIKCIGPTVSLYYPTVSRFYQHTEGSMVEALLMESAVITSSPGPLLTGTNLTKLWTKCHQWWTDQMEDTTTPPTPPPEPTERFHQLVSLYKKRSLTHFEINIIQIIFHKTIHNIIYLVNFNYYYTSFLKYNYIIFWTY